MTLPLESSSEPPADRAPRAGAGSKRRVSLSGLASATGWVTFWVAMVSVLAQRVWPFELVVHFWPQISIVLLATGLARVFAGDRLAGAVHALTALGLSSFVVWNLVGAVGDTRHTDDVAPELRAMLANAASWNEHHDPLIETIRGERPDVVGLVEMNQAWLTALEELEAEYPYRVLAPRPDHYGVALLSRWPISQHSTEAIGPLEQLPSIVATIEASEGPWRVIVTHPVPPFHASAFSSRNRQILDIGRHVLDDGVATVVLADLNATPWSPFVRDLRRSTELRSAARGLRARYTWPVGVPPFALELDYCLYSPPAVSVGYQVLPDVRSDHYPILCSLVREPAGISRTRATGAGLGAGEGR